MKKLLSAVIIATGICISYPGTAIADSKNFDEVVTVKDSVYRVENAREAFLSMPAKVLDILKRDSRMDMLSYLDADTIRPVPNGLGGTSVLIPPVTQDYIAVQVSQVSTIQIKLLPAHKGKIIAVSYTLGGDGTAADSDLSFYDDEWKLLKTSKFISLAETEDFLDLPKHSEELKKELLLLVPFPTIEYQFSPDGDTVTAHLTIGDNLGAEDMLILQQYLRPEIVYTWNGHQFKRK